MQFHKMNIKGTQEVLPLISILQSHYDTGRLFNINNPMQIICGSLKDLYKVFDRGSYTEHNIDIVKLFY